jgi:hypothetical protein
MTSEKWARYRRRRLSRRFRVLMIGEPLLQVGIDSNYVLELSDTIALLSRASGGSFRLRNDESDPCRSPSVDVALVLLC